MDDKWAAEIGVRIKAARRKHRFSRKELAEAIGRSEDVIQSYEQGKRAPFKEIRQIANVLRTDLAQLLVGDQAQLTGIEKRLAAVEQFVSQHPATETTPVVGADEPADALSAAGAEAVQAAEDGPPGSSQEENGSSTAKPAQEK